METMMETQDQIVSVKSTGRKILELSDNSNYNLNDILTHIDSPTFHEIIPRTMAWCIEGLWEVLQRNLLDYLGKKG